MKKNLKWDIAQKAELKWWEQYLKKKDKEEYLVWKKEYWEKLLDMIAFLCPISAGLDVLDAGCGPAGIFMNLSQCHVDAVDPLIDSYAEHLAHFRKNDYPWVQFFSMPIEKYVTDKKYDIIFCMNAINHVSDINKSYDLLVSMLKPQGKLIVTIDAHNHPFYKKLFRMIPGDILHPYQYSRSEYEKFLTSRGLKILQTEKLKEAYFFDHYLQMAGKNY